MNMNNKLLFIHIQVRQKHILIHQEFYQFFLVIIELNWILLNVLLHLVDKNHLMVHLVLQVQLFQPIQDSHPIRLHLFRSFTIIIIIF